MEETIYLDMKKARIMAVLILISITAVLFYFKIKYQVIGLYFKIEIHIISYMILSIFAHELLHGIGFRIFCKAPWKNIRFGFHKKYKVPYCSCMDLRHERNEFIGVMLLPTIINGIITLIITYYSNNLFWTYVMAFVISGGAGDIYMAYGVLKDPIGYKYMDHPTEPGYIVYEN